MSTWGTLDVLLVDLPPGTGDAQLTMAQKAPLSGAVIVSTPQDLALIDAKRAAAMFRKVDVTVYGVVENMSYYECPNCGHREHIFSHGGAEVAAQDMEAPFLGAGAADAGDPRGLGRGHADRREPARQPAGEGLHHDCRGGALRHRLLSLKG